jgi:hypothetical protein
MTTTDTPTTRTDPLADALSELERNAIPWGSPFDNGVDPTTLKSAPIPPPSQYLVRAVDLARLHAIIRDGQGAQAAAVVEIHRLRRNLAFVRETVRPDGSYDDKPDTWRYYAMEAIDFANMALRGVDPTEDEAEFWQQEADAAWSATRDGASNDDDHSEPEIPVALAPRGKWGDA